MRYKRDEAFRFEFGEPLLARFSMDELNGKRVTSSDGEAKIVDVSLKGLKLCTSLSIPVHGNDVKATISFSLNDNPYQVSGTFIWVEKKLNEYYYGIQFELEEEIQDKLLNDLKTLGKNMANQSN
ncbi:PilZ domain-containing protein [Oceanobacillus limi]|uniref:PilZ domain-containing protein n=1 Tax=Oceanobacillus limi TaxID=930131 RepID=A0A1I0DSL6_9BACI|nr:PilZ domain-containing protein [Oceanobacillus limi]SET35590.1 PilZ domain-containing protein [Oceanobacillus limi]